MCQPSSLKDDFLIVGYLHYDNSWNGNVAGSLARIDFTPNLGIDLGTPANNNPLLSLNVVYIHQEDIRFRVIFIYVFHSDPAALKSCLWSSEEEEIFPPIRPCYLALNRKHFVSRTGTW